MCTLLMPLMCLPRRATLSNYFTKGQKLSTPSTFQENTAREEQILLTTPHLYISCTFQHQKRKRTCILQKAYLCKVSWTSIFGWRFVFLLVLNKRDGQFNKQPYVLRKNHLILILISYSI